MAAPGFDVVTQMPVCGHVMNRSGHAWNLNDTLCNAEWPYAAVLEVLRYKGEDKPCSTHTAGAAKVA